MRLNEHTAIATPRVLLVPYERHHVLLYHEWMQDEELQNATASEPLTLPQEYAMQQSWREDNNKLTFIVCRPLDTDDAHVKSTARTLIARNFDDDKHMIGDINLFINEVEEEGDDKNDARQHDLIGEVEIMIARKDMQGRGLGRAALEAFLHYVFTHEAAICAQYSTLIEDEDVKTTSSAREHVQKLEQKGPKAFTYLRVRINADNTRSVRLFESLKFTRISEEPNYFGELELRRLPETDIITSKMEGVDPYGRDYLLLEYRNEDR